jgi:hypothetical protein
LTQYLSDYHGHSNGAPSVNGITPTTSDVPVPPHTLRSRQKSSTWTSIQQHLSSTTIIITQLNSIEQRLSEIRHLEWSGPKQNLITVTAYQSWRRILV